jgi:hypothetical protein
MKSCHESQDFPTWSSGQVPGGEEGASAAWTKQHLPQVPVLPLGRQGADAASVRTSAR